MLSFCNRVSDSLEYRFYVETKSPLSDRDIEKLRLILADGFIPSTVNNLPSLNSEGVIEIGPRLNFATAWSTNLLSICRAVGLNDVVRIERARRLVIPASSDGKAFIASCHDRMTEQVYAEEPISFDTGVKPEPLKTIPLIEDGPNALLKVPGFAGDEFDRVFLYDYFVKHEKRNPTVAEILDLNNANSEHCRHWLFMGKWIIDGQEMPDTLFSLVKEPWKRNPGNSLAAFDDNSGIIAGANVVIIIPKNPGLPSSYSLCEVNFCPTITAETHNFPTGIYPFGGAETGAGGRHRDNRDVRQGARLGGGTTGYSVANLNIPGYKLPWENEAAVYPSNLATPLNILIRGSDGASDYANKAGEPLLTGFVRSGDIILPSGERWANIKPILFSGGIGVIDERHAGKGQPEVGMIIVQIGGPAYRIGVGGGAASSLKQGDQDIKLDFNAVQRGDAEMSRKVDRALKSCLDMGDANPILIAHDQGAGGPANVLKEAVGRAGGRIDLRKINVGDPTMSVCEIWVAEYQERECVLIWPERLEEFQAICRREKVNCEILGEVTGDGRFVVFDSQDGSTPVDLDLSKVLEDLPQKTYTDERKKMGFSRLSLPKGLSFLQALEMVLKLPSVGSKRFLVKKIDRSVKGLVAQQPCCGPGQLTVADFGAMAWSQIDTKGTATSIGERSFLMLGDPEAGARMAVAEAILNLAGAGITSLEDIKCRANWMWAPKLPGEGAALYDAAQAMRDIMMALKIAINGGKDSSSMATKVGGDIVKSFRELVISAYAVMPDIRKKATPDIKCPGESFLLFLDLSNGHQRLGGSALAQVLGQVGNEFPDVDDVKLLKRGFEFIQAMINGGLALSYHDVSDGGLITALSEMCWAGNSGLDLFGRPLSIGLFSEELGVVMEFHKEDLRKVETVIDDFCLASKAHWLAKTTNDAKTMTLHNLGGDPIDLEMDETYGWWEETSAQIDDLQTNSDQAQEEKRNLHRLRKGVSYRTNLSFSATAPDILAKAEKPKALILREEGTNSEEEMASAFYAAGFSPYDVTMTDLLDGRITLDEFRVLAACGGFSYADVPDSAKGWAATILFNEKLAEQFLRFYNRPDTLSLGVCNGCQLFGLLGWVPWLGIKPEDQPRFVHNLSGRFESRWVGVKVIPSQAIALKGFEGSILGIHCDHGEGRLIFPDPNIHNTVIKEGLMPMVLVDEEGEATDSYPFNPNGSPMGITSLCTRDGRHLAMMPHPERSFQTWQWHYLPSPLEEKWGRVSPWLKLFQNMREWCETVR